LLIVIIINKYTLYIINYFKRGDVCKSFLFLLVKFSCCIFTLLELHGKTSHCFVISVIISALLTFVIYNMPEVSLRTVSYDVRLFLTVDLEVFLKSITQDRRISAKCQVVDSDAVFQQLIYWCNVSLWYLRRVWRHRPALVISQHMCQTSELLHISGVVTPRRYLGVDMKVWGILL